MPADFDLFLSHDRRAEGGAVRYRLEETEVRVLELSAAIETKAHANRDKDRAVSPILRQTLAPKGQARRAVHRTAGAAAAVLAVSSRLSPPLPPSRGTKPSFVLRLLPPGPCPTSRKPCPGCARPQGQACGALRAALPAGLRSPRALTGPCRTETTTEGERR